MFGGNFKELRQSVCEGGKGLMRNSIMLKNLSKILIAFIYMLTMNQLIDVSKKRRYCTLYNSKYSTLRLVLGTYILTARKILVKTINMKFN